MLKEKKNMDWRLETGKKMEENDWTIMQARVGSMRNLFEAETLRCMLNICELWKQIDFL